jgi:hypothetical protein
MPPIGPRMSGTMRDDDFDWAHWYNSRGLPVPPEVQGGGNPPGVQDVQTVQPPGTPPPQPFQVAPPSQADQRLAAFQSFQQGQQPQGQQPNHVMTIINGTAQQQVGFNDQGRAYATRPSQPAETPWTMGNSQPVPAMLPGSPVPFLGQTPAGASQPLAGTPGPSGGVASAAGGPMSGPDQSAWQQLLSGVPSQMSYGGIEQGWQKQYDPEQLKMAMDFFGNQQRHQLGMGQLDLAKTVANDKYDPRNIALGHFQDLMKARVASGQPIDTDWFGKTWELAMGAAERARQDLGGPRPGQVPAGPPPAAGGRDLPPGPGPGPLSQGSASTMNDVINRRREMGGDINDLFTDLNPETGKPKAGLEEIGRRLWLEDQARAARGDTGWAARNKQNIMALMNQKYKEGELLDYLYPNRFGGGMAAEAAIGGGLAETGAGLAGKAVPAALKGGWLSRMGGAALGPYGQLASLGKLGYDLFSREKLNSVLGLEQPDAIKGRAAMRALMGYDPNATFYPSRTGG